ncbi:biotin-dependent carboxyltransferase family protein [Demetria terragena]|uniref:5-oxoprolinase subunit C family protein n=1 Tax=Demetria terragena TaxID=63959 RepID=UPI000365AEC1|nr:biotin-dependent carboxyltransferase family protein [Demetria terragena]
MTALVVTRVDTLALVEDSGRQGHRHLGVPPSGAADRTSLGRGNRVVGNDSGAAGIEILLGGFGVQATTPLVIAVTGAPAPVTVGGRPAPFGEAILLSPGDELHLGRVTSGLRIYLTVAGGIAESGSTPRVLGSMSSDPTSSIGPAALQPGTALAVGLPDREPHLGVSIPPITTPPLGLELPATWGPRADWLSDSGRAALQASRWTVSSHTDRVGVRLDGIAAELARHEQLPSEGLVRGCIQVPPNGTPIVFLADHPTTGGYPVVAVVDDAATDRLAQAAPGTPAMLRIR